MALENIPGNLLTYKELVPGTFQHVDQLITEIRINERLGNREGYFTADGELYTVQKRKCLWVITRLPQNLVLENIDEAYQQLTEQKNYFPDVEAAKTSLEHADSVIIDLKGLKLVQINHRCGRFAIDPKTVDKLSSEQRRAAQRIYGPDKDNFGLNMEMFARAGISPGVVVLKPDYVRDILKSNGKKFLGRASSLFNYRDWFSFVAHRGFVDSPETLYGVRRVTVKEEGISNLEKKVESAGGGNELEKAEKPQASNEERKATSAGLPNFFSSFNKWKYQ